MKIKSIFCSKILFFDKKGIPASPRLIKNSAKEQGYKNETKIKP